MFWTRLASGVVLLIIAVSAMAFGGLPLLLILLATSLAAYRELTKALQCSVDGRGCNLLEIIGFLSVAAYYGAAYAGRNASVGGDALYLLMVLTGMFLAELFAYVLLFPKYRAEQAAAAVFSFLYAPVMLAFVYLTRETTQGIYMVWMILISSWGCDTCAYAVGKLIGKKKVFPVLSPHKSLEGCVGGVAGAALIGGLYGHFFVEAAFPDRTVAWIIAFICGVGAIMSMVGDLAASAIKRNHNIKDYGKLIPGHGGIMDRFDSMIITAPMTYFLTILMLRL